MKWIKASVKAGNVRFSYHAEHVRGKERNVSPDEAADAIARGRCVRWEPGEIPSTRVPTMNMTFELKLTERLISAVAAVLDDEPDVVVITVWEDKNRA